MEETSEIAQNILAGNRCRLAAMAELVASEQAIAFIGAGLSRPLGYPTWQELLAALLREARSIERDFRPSVRLTEKNALQFADELQGFFRAKDPSLHRYRETLANKFKLPLTGETSTLVQRFVVRLPFKAWVTTNYDCCLEEALFAVELSHPRSDLCVVVQKGGGNAHTVSDSLLSLDSSKRPSVIHLHGVHSQTEHIILSATDYAQAYGKSRDCPECGKTVDNWTLHRKLVWALLATRRLVFFGCSLADPYVLQLLETVALDLWRRSEAVHFAITPIEKPIVSEKDAAKYEETFREKYGVQLVFYDKEDPAHTGLERLVKQVHAACGDGPHIKPPPDPFEGRPIPSSGSAPDAETAKQLIEAANLESDRERGKDEN